MTEAEWARWSLRSRVVAMRLVTVRLFPDGTADPPGQVAPPGYLGTVAFRIRRIIAASSPPRWREAALRVPGSPVVVAVAVAAAFKVQSECIRKRRARLCAQNIG